MYTRGVITLKMDVIDGNFDYFSAQSQICWMYGRDKNVYSNAIVLEQMQEAVEEIDLGQM